MTKSNMKKLLSVSLLLLLYLTVSAQTNTPQITNRYGMKMTRNADGSYALVSQKKLERIIDISRIPDLYVPYTYVSDRLKSKDYKGVETQDIVFKKHDGYELVLSVDKAVSASPTPFMIYLHGGGWSRGDNGSSRSLSQYLAKQKGITGIRVSYTLAPQKGASVAVSVQDVLDAVTYVQQHARALNVDPNVFGFLGTSAGAHLAAVAAMTVPHTKLLVCYSGIFDLETASLVAKTKDQQRIAYFDQLSAKTLQKYSPVNLIPKKDVPAAMLVCGTCDVTVEPVQSQLFATSLKKRGGSVELLEYPFYDHNLSSKGSDKMEEIFFKTVDFVTARLK